MSETFAARILRIRLSKKVHERTMSQEDAARLFEVSLSCYRRWEKAKGLPDRRSRIRLEEIWPEVFAHEPIKH